MTGDSIYCISGNILDRKPHNGGNGIGYQEGISYTLTAMDRHAVSAPAITMRIRSGCEGGGKGPLLQIEKSGTLATGNDQYLFDPNIKKIMALNGQDGSSITVERPGISPTLHSRIHDKDNILCTATGQSHAEILDDLSPTLNCSNEQPYIVQDGRTADANADILDGQSPALACAHGHPSILAQRYYARRLMPLECERLQGFPDGWTQLGHDGKPISDSRRYQMLGNSIAVPCAAYIMQGIREALSERSD